MTAMNSTRKILNALFYYFEAKNVPYCILHGFETLPEYAVSDIDIALDPQHKKQLDNYLHKITTESKFSIIQKLYYDIPSGFYYVLAKINSEEPSIVQLDFLIDGIGINRYCLTSNNFLAQKEKYQSFWVPSYGIQAVYLLIKRAVKDKFYEKHLIKLQELCHKKPEEVNSTVDKYLSTKVRNKIVSAIGTKSQEKLDELVPEIRKLIKFKYGSKKLLKAVWEVRRALFRVFSPTGSCICILSPDGGGKSSVAKQSLKILLGAFRRSEYLHWRPGVLPQIRTLLGKSKLENEFIFTNPHSSRKRSRLTSFVRWFYYSLDYVLGNYLKILPMKIKTTAVVMDRYYYDIIVDPIRYGFNLPRWVFKSVLPIIPKPDLTIYLDNTPEELYKRKQELPISELKRQVEAWRKLIPSLPNARIVTTDKPLEDVVNEVAKLVLERRAEMTRKTLKIDPDESKYLWRSDISGYIALPSKQNCRWIIPINLRLAKRAWDLYLPYSPAGRIYKNLYRFISSKGLLKYLKQKKLDLGLVDEKETLKKILVNLFKKDDLFLSISTGTPRPFRKITAMILDSEAKVLGYIKIGETPLSIERIKNEIKILRVIGDRSWIIGEKQGNRSKVIGCGGKDYGVRIRVPECLYEGTIGNAYMMVQSPAPFEGKSGGSEFDEDYANVLRGLPGNTNVKKKFVESEFYKKIKEGVENYPLSYRDIMKRSLEHLEENIGDKEITFTISHGDFAPWNMVWTKNKKEVFLFDWESATFEAPAGIDLIHFLFQTGFLLRKLRNKRLFNYISQNPFLSVSSSLPPEVLITLYCIFMAVTEDYPQQLSNSAVERRGLVKLLIGNR